MWKEVKSSQFTHKTIMQDKPVLNSGKWATLMRADEHSHRFIFPTPQTEKETDYIPHFLSFLKKAIHSLGLQRRPTEKIVGNVNGAWPTSRMKTVIAQF